MGALPAVMPVLAVVLALVLLYLFLERPWLKRWGATDEDVRRCLPGDDLVPRLDRTTTRSIRIPCPPAQAWPWLA